MKQTIHFQKIALVIGSWMTLICLGGASSVSVPLPDAFVEQRIETTRTRLLQEALGRYEIGGSRISFSGTTVQLVFPLSDEVPDGSVSTTTFSDVDCSVDISGNSFLVSSIIYDENPNPDGTKNREIIVRYAIDPTLIQQSDVWVQDEDDQFFMNFCVSINLHMGEANTTATLSTLETIVLLQVDLMGDFGNEIDVLPNDPNAESALQVYYVEGFICDENREEIAYTIPRVQGSIIRVCVKPTDDALEDGIYMRRVDSFTYQRDDQLADGAKITQVALRGGDSADPVLTRLFCERGWELCYFDTLLKSDFYFSPGSVYGFGEAWLQFGTGNVRKLKFTIRNPSQGESLNRGLQEVDEGFFAGSSQFNLDFFVIPGQDFQYGAVAYECDNKNRKVEDLTPKRLGDTIRVCVAPNEASAQFGITINRIDSWKWTRKEGTAQTSVEVGGDQAEDGLTILMCVPGSKLCIFRTQFIPDFYGSVGQLYGVGDVVLQFAQEGISMTRRRLSRPKFIQKKIAKDTGRALQQASTISFESIAGKVPLKLNTNVAESKDGVPERCKYEHKVTEWWVEEPIEDRYMYIGVAIGILAAIACSFLLCWCFPCLARSEEEVEEKEQDIKVNVDVKADKQENHVSNKSSTQNESKNVYTSRNSETSTHDSSEEHDSLKRTKSSRGLKVPCGSADVEPNSDDVCFDERSHPGTRQLLKVIRRFLRDSPDEPYGSDSYRLIKKELGDVRFFQSVEGRKYVEASKKESIARIGDLYVEVKKGKVKRSSSRSHHDDLESNTSSHDRSRSSKRSKDDDRRSSKRREECSETKKRSSKL